MNKKLSLPILIIALGIAAWFYFSNSEIIDNGSVNAYVFSCPGGVEIEITYNEDADTANLFIEEKEYKLKRVISASGARYANEDETVIFWEHQGEAMVEIDGETIYQGCALKE